VTFFQLATEKSPDKVTFGFALRKSSLGLILGIFTHLILLLARFTKPLNKKDKRIMKLEGRIMFPSADVSLPIGHV